MPFLLILNYYFYFVSEFNASFMHSNGSWQFQAILAIYFYGKEQLNKGYTSVFKFSLIELALVLSLFLSFLAAIFSLLEITTNQGECISKELWEWNIHRFWLMNLANVLQ